MTLWVVASTTLEISNVENKIHIYCLKQFLKFGFDITISNCYMEIWLGGSDDGMLSKWFHLFILYNSLIMLLEPDCFDSLVQWEFCYVVSVRNWLSPLFSFGNGIVFLCFRLLLWSVYCHWLVTQYIIHLVWFGKDYCIFI